MLVDLGMRRNDTVDLNLVRNFIAKIDKEFDLVMTLERYNESLVLLKHLMNWDFEDIVYVKLNAAKQDNHLSEKAHSALRGYLAGDYLLYNYFAKKLEKQIHRFGEINMQKELQEFARTVAKVVSDCGIKYVTELPSHQKGFKDNYVKHLDVVDPQNETCVDFIQKEDNFLHKLKYVQLDRLKKRGVDVDAEETKWNTFWSWTCQSGNSFHCCKS